MKTLIITGHPKAPVDVGIQAMVDLVNAMGGKVELRQDAKLPRSAPATFELID